MLFSINLTMAFTKMSAKNFRKYFKCFIDIISVNIELEPGLPDDFSTDDLMT